MRIVLDTNCGRVWGIVDCALNAGADYIVTNDKHFKVLENIDFPKVNILRIDKFKEKI